MSTIPQQSRANDANVRQARRNRLDPAQQILALRDRPGQSSRELARLTKLL